jgi:hypothetical protein
MPVWEYKVISSGKGGFASPALLESFLNQLGGEEWEIIEFRGQPDNPLAFSGLARRSTQRDWTLEGAAAAAAKAEADKLRQEFAAKFKGASGAGPAAGESAEEAPAPQGDDGLRRLRDTEHDSDPEAPEAEASEDDWDKLGAEDALPTFFEALRPHLRRNQRGPGMSVGVDFLAKKWDLSEDDVLGALKECGLEVPEDEDAKPVYVDYDGDLYWVNVNRRGEYWVNTKEKARPVFRTVQATRVEPPEGAAAPETPRHETARHETSRHEDHRAKGRDEAERESAAPAEALPRDEALLARIRPQMRRNRREPGASGSVSFLSRALKCGEGALVDAFKVMGLVPPASAAEAPVHVDIGAETWWLNKDQRGNIWINVGERRAGGGGGEHARPAEPSSAAGNALAALRLLLKETKTGAVAAPIERLASELGKPAEELLGALTSAGLRVPEKAREKPAFAEHAGEVFWLNRNAKGELWLNAKASKYSDGGAGDASRGRRGRGRKRDAEGMEAPEGEPGVAEAPALSPPESAAEPQPAAPADAPSVPPAA